jgi:quercetin dioxygenase-like cupin family protein
MKDSNQTVHVIDSTTLPWEEHPRINHVYMKSLLTPDENPLANISLVNIPVGQSVTRHLHATEVESIYVLSGQGELVLGSDRVPVKAGSVAAIPIGLEHELHNTGDESIELLAFFTPPIE